MTLKPDEEFVKNCLVKHFGKKTTTAWEGEDPPDIYIKINKETVAGEITRLSPVSFDQDGSVQNRNTQDYFGINLCDELDSKLKNYVPADVDIILTLYVPIENVRKYKKELQSHLKKILVKGIKAGDKSEIIIFGSKVHISVVPCRNHSQKKIVGLIVNNNSSAHILSNAEVIIAGRVLDKVEKCKKIKHKGALWLALFNDYWLADHETYAQAISNIKVKHDFENFFVVLDTGFVHQLM